MGAYASTLFLTLTNPVAIISFAAVFAGWGLVGTGGGYRRWLYDRGDPGIECFHRLIAMVVPLGGWSRHLTGEVQFSRAEVGEQSFRWDHNRLWIAGPAECGVMGEGYI